MYLTTSPKLLRYLMPAGLIWEIPTSEKVLYLTFDDGPVAGITDKALEILDSYQAKATFFCVGDNVRKYPDIYEKIIAAGHRTGNHTFHHLNGWKTPDKEYVEDIELASEAIKSQLFRPPYGRIRRSQVRQLSKSYQIIMWSLLAGDFDPRETSEQCFRRVVRYAKHGSVIVLHDQQKTAGIMLKVLPLILEHFSKLGYNFLSL
jgi:peptidoglycan/xylan/chitin deacetylase (PgdA/CDA1 family)